MTINKYRCHCGSSRFYVREVKPHVGLYCERCGKFFKWLNKDEVNLVKHLGGNLNEHV